MAGNAAEAPEAARCNLHSGRRADSERPPETVGAALGAPGDQTAAYGAARCSCSAAAENYAAARSHAHAVGALLLATCGPLGFCTFWCLYLSGGSPACVTAGKALASAFAAALPLLAACQQGALPAVMSRPAVLRLCLAACLGCDLVGHALAQQAWCAVVAPGPGCELTFFFDFHAGLGATAPLTGAA